MYSSTEKRKLTVFMRKYYLISPGSLTSKQMLRDLETYKKDSFCYMEEPIRCENKFIRKALQLYFRVNSRINLPLKCLWHRFFTLSHIDLSKDDNYIILGNGIFNYYDSAWLNRLKEKYHVHYILYYIDPISGLMSKYMKDNIEQLNKEITFTFDFEDSRKIDAIHTMCLYSKKDVVPVRNIRKNSVYFVGMNKKNRVEAIHKIWDRLQSGGIECDFNIVGVDKDNQTKKEIHYNMMQTYDEILENIQPYQCILEVLQPGQSGVTLRYYEAVLYNKKLITNNQLVKKLPFYNSDYIQVFDKVEDIDIEWIKKEVQVDYNYQDEFSPVNFLKEIEELTGQEK